MFFNLFSGTGYVVGDVFSKSRDNNIFGARLAISNSKSSNGSRPLVLPIEACGTFGDRLSTAQNGDKIGLQGRLVVEQDGAVKVVLDDEIAFLQVITPHSTEEMSMGNYMPENARLFDLLGIPPHAR